MTKPIFEKVPLIQTSFLFKEEIFNQFHIPFHIHPEFEIALVTNTINTKFIIGDYQKNLDGTTLYLLGQNIPHSWVAVDADSNSATSRSKQLIIQFKKEFLGYYFFQQPEFVHINELLNRSARGIEFYGETLSNVLRLLKRMKKSDAFRKTIFLLEILDIMARSNEYNYLSSLGYLGETNLEESTRMNDIFRYMIDNFKNDIDLRDIAEHANMTETSFCKFFKDRTKKTFVAFLNEIRVGHACKLIIRGNKSINQVCFESGFRNLSNFNRQFKKITGYTPSSYNNKGVVN